MLKQVQSFLEKQGGDAPEPAPLVLVPVVPMQVEVAETREQLPQQLQQQQGSACGGTLTANTQLRSRRQQPLPLHAAVRRSTSFQMPPDTAPTAAAVLTVDAAPPPAPAPAPLPVTAQAGRHVVATLQGPNGAAAIADRRDRGASCAPQMVSSNKKRKAPSGPDVDEAEVMIVEV